MESKMPFVLGNLLVLFHLAVAPAAEQPFRYPAGRQGDKAELKYVNGLPVLVVSGTPEEMGSAVGLLALVPAKRVLGYPRDLLKEIGTENLYGLFAWAGNGMVKQFPADYQTEMESMIKAARVDRADVVVGNTFFDLHKVFLCSALLLEPQRSKTGGPLLGRNLDYPSLGYINEYSLVTVYRPAGKHAFASVGFPGLVGCVSGMNDAGLALGILEAYDVKRGVKKFDPLGVPYALCLRKVLEECTTIAEAKKLLEGLPQTTLYNVVLADRQHVAVLEVAPARLAERTPEKGTAACTNHFLTEAMKPASVRDIEETLERFQSLDKTRRGAGKLGPDDMRQQLDAVNLGDFTLQTMVFEPCTLRLHLSLGKVPASKQPLRILDLGPLFQ